MSLQRRRFFSGLAAVVGGVLAAPAVQALPTPLKPASQPDRFTYRGYDVQWCGYRRSVNQAIELGFWTAFRLTRFRLGDAERPFCGRIDYVSTTGGVVSPFSELDCIDGTIRHRDGWTTLTPYSTDADRERLKQRALHALLTTLRKDSA